MTNGKNIVVSGHQPVYLPWLGLIHKALLADVFVFMDDVQYLEQDWNNRNRIKGPQGQPLWLTVPVDLKRSGSMMLKEVLIATQDHLPEQKRWQAQHWKSIQMAYGKAPFFAEYKPFFEDVYLGNKWERLADLNLAILRQILVWFAITAELKMASQEKFTEKKSDLVLEHCLRFDADLVVTGTQGRKYIRLEDFSAKNIKVVFQEYRCAEYPQRFGPFIPQLSFIDLLFNCGPDSREKILEGNLTRETLWQNSSN